MNPIAQLVDAWRVVQADRKFPAPRLEVVRPDGQVKVGGLLDPGVLAGRALTFAIAELGCGETSNNCGPDVERYIAPARAPANWCAGFVGWCYHEAASQLEVALPFARSLGAKRLGRNIGAVGRIFQDPFEAKPGDVIVWDRGTTGSWMGHIGIVRRVSRGNKLLAVVEGNSGPLVCQRIYEAPLKRLAFLASLRR